jgi:hypothetical protein
MLLFYHAALYLLLEALFLLGLCSHQRVVARLVAVSEESLARVLRINCPPRGTARRRT